MWKWPGIIGEIQKGVCKVSARSKSDYNVNALMRQFGGGGHAKASGATIEGEFGAVCEQLLAAASAGFEEGSIGRQAHAR